LARLDDSPVYDVDVRGNTVYVAQGTKGIGTVDVTHPGAPVIVPGMEAAAGSSIEVVSAAAASAIGGGAIGDGAVVQVAPDVVLKVDSLVPDNGIVDRQPGGELEVRARFSKAIDLYPDNLSHFKLRGPSGLVPTTVSIVNNDAILTLPDVSGLHVGDALSLEIQAGVASVKPINGVSRVLYSLRQDQSFPFVYRGSRPDNLSIDSVVPRHVPTDRAQNITVSVLGASPDKEKLQLFVAGQSVPITGVIANAGDERTAILTATLPALGTPGQYDVEVESDEDGVWERVKLRGALIADAPVLLTRASPGWGPLAGGTQVTLTGQGFQPGNSVADGLTLRVGDRPGSNVRVLSSQRMTFTTPVGRSGKNDVTAADRYGNSSTLSGDDGFGYGISKLGTLSLSFAPSDIHVSRGQHGIAFVSGGLFSAQNVGAPLSVGGKDRNLVRVLGGRDVPDPILAGSIDVNDPLHPLLVAGASSLPPGPDIEARIAAALASTAPDGASFNFGPPDSVMLWPATEYEQGVAHQRLYVAGGPGGVLRVNTDDATGLQRLDQQLANSTLVSGVVQTGADVFATGNGVSGACEAGVCGHCPVGTQAPRTQRLTYLAPNDAVQLPDLVGADAGGFVKLRGNWLLASGLRAPIEWFAVDQCEEWPGHSLDKQLASAQVELVNLTDPALNHALVFSGPVYDLVNYGDYLVAALGQQGL
ncbi:MAG TPA: IPT/TIG domain-containing protein, partial [Polyangiaceae bacterium]|nr:IPT/TIG domain-containing protein [Polyangiaceae bacterium]